jgi:hypothetical protein
MLSDKRGQVRPMTLTNVLLPELGSAEVAASIGEWIGTS